jgi:aspartate aminotransferase-like enzyme
MATEHDGRIDLDELIALIDSDTKLVAISAVQFASGFTVDLERIAKAAHAVDALLAVDIIQALGAKGFDLPALGVDIAPEQVTNGCVLPKAADCCTCRKSAESGRSDIRRLDQRRDAVGL